MNCLLIDDDSDDQEIFRICLQQVRPDVSLTVANNGVDALKLLADEVDYVPSIIFLDVNMPRMNGMECLEELRAITRLSKTCIYVYSTTSEESILKRSQELGASDYLIKPIKAYELREMLKKIFDKCDSGSH